MAEVINPNKQTISLSIDRANRLHSLVAHQGWNDLIAISEETVRIAERALVDFAGWDKDELVARSIGFRAAKKSHERLLNGVGQAIQAGIEEAALLRGSEDPYSSNAADMADDLRVKVLQQLESTKFDSRVSGTF